MGRFFAQAAIFVIVTLVVASIRADGAITIGNLLFGACIGIGAASAIRSGARDASPASPAPLPPDPIVEHPDAGAAAGGAEGAPAGSVSSMAEAGAKTDAGVVAASSATLSQPAAPLSGTLYCPACGAPNPTWRSECEQCRTRLVPSVAPSYSTARQRPGCVTAYAILLGAVVVIVALGGAIAGIGQIADPRGNDLAGAATLVVATIVAVLYALLARGLWQLKNWARNVIVVLNGLGLAFNLFSLCAVLGRASSQRDSGPALLSTFVGLAIGGLITYWFASHREVFD